MEKTNLVVQIEKPLLESATAYAEDHNISLADLVAAFLRSLTAGEEVPSLPILNALSGILPPDASVEDYRDYLEEKYGL